MFPFVQRPEYEDSVKDDIILILYHFVKIAIGEGDEIAELIPNLFEGVESQSIESKSLSQSSSESSNVSPPREPFMIILDNAHKMDPASWDLYEAIRDGCYRIALILILQTDFNEDVKIH